MTDFKTDEYGRFYEPEYPESVMTDTEKDIAALDEAARILKENQPYMQGDSAEWVYALAVSVIERNKAAIEECKKQIAASESIVEELYGEEGAYQQGRIGVLYGVLEVLEGVNENNRTTSEDII